jgi:hypothetical protein
MIVVGWEVSRSMRTYDFVVVMGSMIVQCTAPKVYQTRVPYLMLGVIFTSKYEVSSVLCQCHEKLDKKWSVGWDVYSVDCNSLCPGWDNYHCEFKCCKLW